MGGSLLQERMFFLPVNEHGCHFVIGQAALPAVQTLFLKRKRLVPDETGASGVLTQFRCVDRGLES